MCRCGAQLAHDSYSASCGTVQQESWLLTLSARTVNRSPMNKTKMYWTAELLLQLLGAPGIATRSEDLVGAPGLTTRSKKLLGAPGIAPQGSAWMALHFGWRPLRAPRVHSCVTAFAHMRGIAYLCIFAYLI